MNRAQLGLAAAGGLVGLVIVASLAVPQRGPDPDPTWLPTPAVEPSAVEPPAVEPPAVERVERVERAGQAQAVANEMPAPAALQPVNLAVGLAGTNELGVTSTAVARPEPAVVLRTKPALGGRLAAQVRVASLGGIEVVERPLEFRAEYRRDGDQAALGLAQSRDHRLEGFLVEEAQGVLHLRGWFELPAGASEVGLPFLGRWVDVEMQPAGERASLGIEAGPRSGWRPPLFAAAELEGGTRLRVWVPRSAAALVATADDGRRTRATLTDGAAELALRLPATGR